MTAVVLAPRTVPGPFVGDHDNMVDRLIEACAAAKHDTRYLSFERELQPVADAWLEPINTKYVGLPVATCLLTSQ